MKNDEPARMAVRGNSALVLEGRDAWAIDHGSLAVFATSTNPEAVAGPRQFLFTCCRGELVIPPDPKAGDQTLLIAGLEDSQLRQLTRQRLAEQLLEEHTETCTAVKTWVEKLTSLLTRGTEREPVERIGSQNVIHLAAGQVVGRPGQELIWLQVESGQVHLLDSPQIRYTPDSGLFPLAGEAWLHADLDTRLERLDVRHLSEATVLSTALMRFQHDCLHQLCREAQSERRVTWERLLQRQHWLQQDTLQALEELGAVLNARPVPRRAESELLTALMAIADRLGVRLSGSARTEGSVRPGDPVDAIARSSQVRTRRVRLEHHWWQRGCGSMLGYLAAEQRPVALLPAGTGGYDLFDPQDGTYRRVDVAAEPRLAREAICFYRPFPHRMAGIQSLLRFAARPLAREIVLVTILAIAGAMLGMLVPQATRLLIDQAIPNANVSLLVQLALGLLAVSCGQAAFLFVQAMATVRLQILGTTDLQAATWDRLLGLRAAFFRTYSSGDLLNRSMMVTEISQEVGATSMRSIVTATMSVLNLGLLFYYSAKLAWLAVVVAIISGAFTLIVSRAVRKKAFLLDQMQGQLFGFVVQLIGGLAKLRVAGAEQRAFNQWARKYASQSRLVAAMTRLQDLATLYTFVLPLFSSMVLYYLAGRMSMTASLAANGQAMTMGTFVAFSAAFGAFVAGTMDASSTLVQIMDSIGKGRLIRPILESEREVSPEHKDPGRLSGNVAVNHVTFRYRADGPPVLKDVCLHAEPGEFVALAGPSGSGKSTVLRLLLGVDTPESGTILYDHHDLQDLNVTLLRRQVGTVQQATRVSACSIFEFLAGGSSLTLDEAWELAREVGLADEIEALPMGMHTILSEGGTNFSGGQRQRLLIARALAQNPRILLFDEATSALDNRSQQVVSHHIARRSVTRIVVAHRLSTIRDADRIYVLRKGVIEQVGTYDQLAGQEGLFRRMMLRQTA